MKITQVVYYFITTRLTYILIPSNINLDPPSALSLTLTRINIQLSLLGLHKQHTQHKTPLVFLSPYYSFEDKVPRVLFQLESLNSEHPNLRYVLHNIAPLRMNLGVQWITNLAHIFQGYLCSLKSSLHSHLNHLIFEAEMIKLWPKY